MQNVMIILSKSNAMHMKKINIGSVKQSYFKEKDSLKSERCSVRKIAQCLQKMKLQVNLCCNL